MICNDCENGEAKWILERDDQYLLVCDACLKTAIQFEGEINLDFWLIELGDFQTIFNNVNRKLKYHKEMYGRAYSSMREFQERNTNQAKQIRQLKGRTGICTACGNVCV